MYWMNLEAIEHIRRTFGNDEEKRMCFEDIFFGNVAQYCREEKVEDECFENVKQGYRRALIGGWVLKQAANEAHYFVPEEGKREDEPKYVDIRTDQRKPPLKISADGAGFVVTYKAVLQTQLACNMPLLEWQKGLEGAIGKHPDSAIIEKVLE